MSIRVSPISKTAALLIVAVGLFTLAAGLFTGVVESTVAGVAFITMGVILYRLLFRFTRKLEREIRQERSD